MAIEKLKTKFASGAWINNVKSYFTKINEIIDYINGDNGLGTKRYVALLSQSGTDAPNATILVNTLGVVPVWSYDDVGQYIITAEGKFTLLKTAVKVSQTDTDGGKRMVYQHDEDSITLFSYDSLGAQNDGELSDGNAYTVIEIEVYP